MSEKLKICPHCKMSDDEYEHLKAEMKVLISYLEDGHEDWALDKLKAYFRYLWGKDD